MGRAGARKVRAVVLSVVIAASLVAAVRLEGWPYWLGLGGIFLGIPWLVRLIRDIKAPGLPGSAGPWLITIDHEPPNPIDVASAVRSAVDVSAWELIDASRQAPAALVRLENEQSARSVMERLHAVGAECSVTCDGPTSDQ